jgi:hypothetical protein
MPAPASNLLGQAPAGIQKYFENLDSRFHGNDGKGVENTFSGYWY